LLVHQGKTRLLEATTPSPPLNLTTLVGEHHRVDTFDFAPGDQLLLYTDGVTEARDRTGTFFPLPDWAQQQGQTPPRELLDRLHVALLHYCGGKLDDDVAALVVRCPDAGAGEYRL
jgi:serine phosphatase RsbU (regulator of sigma subunit)